MLEVIYKKKSEEESRTAIIYEGKKISYYDLNKSILALADVFRKKGIGFGDKVVVILPNCPEFIYAVFGAWKLGAIVVPLDFRLKPNEYSFIFEEVNPKLIVTSEEACGTNLLKVVETAVETIDKFKNVEILTREFDLAKLGKEEKKLNTINKFDNITQNFIAMIQYTSGTMGRPKGIIKNAEAFVQEAKIFAERMKYTYDDVIMTAIPLYHAYGFGDALISGLYAGASLVLEESSTGRCQMEKMQKYGVTVFPGVPFMFGMVCKLQNIQSYDLKSLRSCISAGAPLAEDIAKEFENKFKIYISSLYGSSETNTICVNTDIQKNKCYTSVGTAIEGVEILIKDENEVNLSVGLPGDIWIKSTIAGTGYLDRPEQDREYFRNGYVVTGDVGYIDDNGLLHITGRKKNFINVGGEKVDPSDVEIIIKKHPKVKDCIVIGTYDDLGGQIVKAVIVPISKNLISRKEVIVHCKCQLAPYKVPRIVEFIDEIPISPTGKILRRLFVD